MVNHVRTLLLNLRPASAPYPAGEEFVPTDYNPVMLPPLLTAARKALFGSSPSRAGLNLNLARLLCYAHTSPVGPDILIDDNRVTYDPYVPKPDIDVEATDYNFVFAANGFPDSDQVFRTGGSETDTRWAEIWLDPMAPAPLRASALALALAARTDEVRNGG